TMTSTIRPRLFITLHIPSQFIHSLERVFDLDYQDIPTPLSREQTLSRIRA
ncbi:unnamed protein product, partial [Rotaria sordida]